MDKQDTRWQQRLANFQKALARLEAAVTLSQERPLSDLEEQGLIQAFEFTHELAWKTLKDFLESQGQQNLYGSKDVTRLAFSTGLIHDGHTWMEMIRNRNETSHTYNEETANRIAKAISNTYLQCFLALATTLSTLKNES